MTPDEETMTSGDAGYVALMERVLNQPPPRATYYRKDGVAIHDQPADPYGQERAKKKGWSLTPPAHPVPLMQAPRATAASEAPAPAVRVEVSAPPRHIHVYETEALGTPCLVRGCDGLRQNPKTAWSKKARKS